MNLHLIKVCFLGVAGAICLLSSCQKDMVAPDQNNNPKVRPLATQEVKTISSSNDFAFRAFAALRAVESEQNLFISPLSISSALTMTYNGADGTTKEAMRQTLGFEPQTDVEINQAYKSLTELLINMDKKVTLTTANSIWYAQQFQLQAPFVQNNKTYFNATVQGLDFASPSAKNTINNWVKDYTQGKIASIVQEIRPEHVLFLVNAIYFKGTWTYPFTKNLTKPAPFRKEDGSTVNVDFMTMEKGRYLVYEDAQKQVIDLPYGNRQFSMTLIVPKEQNTVRDIAANLSSSQLATWLSNADSTSLELHLPKFKLEYKKELSETLTQLGMGEAFSNQANFSRMLSNSNQGLAISEVMHKAFVEVNEEGTEAAAATSVGIVVTSLPSIIQVNRPFVFLIREKSTNAILFIGQLMNPQ
ncbi:proteinase inhibitor I4 serpin [Adhaeribacter arboris]|uniref:Proteinase inhibitor I4 serpin n=1 Tax=Adhaeribacter arboris TaxID=2072846 RepID=A0A2T2YDE0_9BACT|nr:serpin family protein [Adhaeribacter arboris]PSR53524.1 proteinase inhibitor I4 serpin [Adhaeribacter arboris]